MLIFTCDGVKPKSHIPIKFCVILTAAYQIVMHKCVQIWPWKNLAMTERRTLPLYPEGYRLFSEE